MKEYILCSAVYFDDNKEHIHQPKNIKTGFVICRRRHHNCIATASKMANYYSERSKWKKTEGFLTNEDNFYDRIKSLEIAKENGQLKKELNSSFLTSEDLW